MATPLLVTAENGSCGLAARDEVRAKALQSAAHQEYAEFNGHQIDARGRMWKFGAVESESESLLNANSGAADEQTPQRLTWRRLWHYWETLDRRQGNQAQNRRIHFVPGLLAGQSTQKAQRPTLADVQQQLANTPLADHEIVQQALIRTALVDAPWSGAFISYLMHQAGLSDEEFAFSGAHAMYIQPALQSRAHYAYRACNPQNTQPRVGDLLCYSRDTPPLMRYSDWQAQSDALNGRVRSHCDLVVDVDLPARKIKLVGGNVMQSVTKRTLMLNQAGVLSSQHMAGLHNTPQRRECLIDPSCHKDNLNIQHWSILLQLK